MKRYTDIDRYIDDKKFTDEEVMAMNELIFARNIIEFKLQDVVRAHDYMVIPMIKDGKVIRRMGIYEKGKVRKTDVDEPLMNGDVRNKKFLTVPRESVVAKIFEKDEEIFSS